MSPSPLRVRERLRRRVDALRPSTSGSDALQRVVERGSNALARTAAARSLVERRAAETLQGFADVAASRLLTLDDDAAQLAMVVERLTAGRDHDDVARIMLRRNLVLDGTFLALLEPILSGNDLDDTPPEVIDRGVDTIALLLAELIDDVPGGPTDPMQRLQEHLDEAERSVLLPILDGSAPLPERTRFVTLTYAIFLESWLLRFSARTVGELLTTHDDSAPAIETEVS